MALAAPSFAESDSPGNPRPIQWSVAAQGGILLSKLGVGEDTYLFDQLRLEPSLRMAYYLIDHLYLGHGLGSNIIFASPLSAGIGRVGFTSFFIDLALGYLPPVTAAIDRDLSAGLEFRQSFHYGVVQYSELYLFYTRSTIRPRLVFTHAPLEIALPLSLSWRTDPQPMAELGLELSILF
jgi:hypothetical protein